MATEQTKKTQKSYECQKCDFLTCKKTDYNRHILTQKHIINFLTTDVNCKNEKLFCCDYCDKVFSDRSGLWRHKRKCAFEKPVDMDKKDTVIDLLIAENKDFKNIILELVKNNSDFQKQMLDVCKTSNNTIITNNNNKTFNLQVFLNEKCKDAMNIMDFVNSMTLEFSDLEDVGKLGYVEGISNIIIRKLNEMDIHKRPIHCSDGKREIMFVRDDNVWEKENSTYDKLRKAIKHITKKNGDMMIPWSKEHPACMNIEHHLNDVYIQIMNQSMGGKESFVESENKIMKKIAKAVLIDKM